MLDKVELYYVKFHVATIDIGLENSTSKWYPPLEEEQDKAKGEAEAIAIQEGLEFADRALDVIRDFSQDNDFPLFVSEEPLSRHNIAS